MSHALQVLEFGRVLELLAAECQTRMAIEAAARLQPSYELSVVVRLLAQTQEAHELMGSESVPSLALVQPLQGAVDRASKGSALDGSTLHAIGASLQQMRVLRQLLQDNRERYESLWRIGEALANQRPLEERLLSSLDADGYVRDEASPELARLRKLRVSLQARIVERISAYTTGSKRDLLSDPIYTQRQGRYVIPLKAEHRGKIKGLVHDASGSGQTIYVEPEDVLALGNSLREAEAAEKAETERILAELSVGTGKLAPEISAGIDSAGHLDLVFAKARLGYEMRAVPPEVRQKPRHIEVSGGRHPLLDPEEAVPLSIEVGLAHEAVLITGPNTGGKTVAIKTVGLFVAMAQSGLMLPAKGVRLGVFSQLWADIGDEQSLQQSLSTFSGHIKNIAAALAGLRPGALVLLDEVGAGTDPAEGAALARAILLSFQEGGAAILASTHYGELKVFASNTAGFVNAAMEFDLKSLRPTYRLMVGVPGASHGFRIAERYGIPREVVDRARAGVGEESQEVAKMLESLEQAQRRAQRSQSEADRLAGQLKRSEAEAAERLQQLTEARRAARDQASQALQATIREIRLEAAEIFESLKQAGSDREREAARERLKTLQTGVAKELEDLGEPAGAGTKIEKGMQVRLDGSGQAGTVLDVAASGKAQVQIGAIRMTVAQERLTPVGRSEAPKSQPRRAAGTRPAVQASLEIQLRRLRAEEAEEELAKFLDQAVLAGQPFVRIVHGKGGGVLRQLTHRALKANRHVRSFALAAPSEGGEGVTVAVLA